MAALAGAEARRVSTLDLAVWALLVVMSGLLVLDLRAAGRPAGSLSGVVGMEGGQSNHCDACRRAMGNRLRPWLFMALAVLAVGLVAGPWVALAPGAPKDLPLTVMLSSVVIAVTPFFLMTRHAASRVRVTQHGDDEG
ncbi:hypothetical protein SAMN05445756_0434 [Kytococcus aerolatus]|uniref:Uncharacterized protein n=1 Tax=Kytococcus aerolatus TaxID=592308 RepID=A0A212T5C2_9MICO|nr:hypothetical protein SAMN05445756_0434 [Kytococcus aerolatus]